LVNLLRPNSGAFPIALVLPVIEAIEGLEFGQPSSLFTPVKKGRKAGLRELRQQLRAIAFIAYRRAKGIKKKRAIEEVAKEFAVSDNTIMSWEKRLRKTLGELEIARTIAFAKNAASFKDARAEYGPNALKKAGEQYKAILKDAKRRSSAPPT
jgi:hypothetical protein